MFVIDALSGAMIDRIQVGVAFGHLSTSLVALVLLPMARPRHECGPSMFVRVQATQHRPGTGNGVVCQRADPHTVGFVSLQVATKGETRFDHVQVLNGAIFVA